MSFGVDDQNDTGRPRRFVDQNAEVPGRYSKRGKRPEAATRLLKGTSGANWMKNELLFMLLDNRF